MDRSMLRAALNVVALLATIGVNALANILPFNGVTTGDVANMFPVKFVPAGYVFSIWSVIYIALGAFVIYQALPAYRSTERVERVGWLFILTCVFNSFWIVAWHYQQFAVSVLLMLGLLATLIMIYRRLNVGREALRTRDIWLVQVPFSLYLSWITVATIANISIFLYDLGWRGDPLSESVWAVIMLLAGVLITLLVALRHRDVAYTLVILWAYVGIVVKQSDLTATAALILAVVVAGLALVAFFRSAPNLRPKLSS